MLKRDAANHYLVGQFVVVGPSHVTELITIQTKAAIQWVRRSVRCQRGMWHCRLVWREWDYLTGRRPWYQPGQASPFEILSLIYSASALLTCQILMFALIIEIRSVCRQVFSSGLCIFSSFIFSSTIFFCLQVICLDDDASSLSGQEVTVERKVVFRLDLPNRKTILVKSRGCNSLSHVLRPILIKYGYSIDMVTLCLVSMKRIVYIFKRSNNDLPPSISSDCSLWT